MCSQFEEKEVLVTGGAGFIGSHLSRELVKRGALVRVLDNFKSGSIENIRDILSCVTLIKGDVRNYHIVEKAVGETKFIFHLAANASVPMSTANPEYDFDTNTRGVFNVLKASYKRADDAIIVFTSSAAVYGEPIYTPVDEDHPLKPISFYGASKLTGETYCKAFHNMYGMKTVILRLFNIYGPGQNHYVMYDLLRKLSQNPFRLRVLGTGEQERDFNYITDCVTALLLAAVRKEAIGKAINVGTGVSTTVKQLVELILELLNLKGKTKIVYTGESWKGDLKTLIANITLSRNLLRYSPQIELKRGLKDFLIWYKDKFEVGGFELFDSC